MPRPRKPASPFRYFNSSPEVIRLVVMMYVRFPLSLRNVEDLLFERGIDISHETVRCWWNRFGPLFAGDIRRQRVSRMRGLTDTHASRTEVLRAIDILSGTRAPTGKGDRLSTLAALRPQDALVLYFSGHGVVVHREFYAISYPEKPSTDMTQNISASDLRQHLEAAPTGNIFLVLDTCSSGAALQGEDERAGPLDARGLIQLAYEKDMNVLAATQPDSVAYERSALRHGLLTYALAIEGLSGGKAYDGRTGGQITTVDLMRYASHRVADLQRSHIDDAAAKNVLVAYVPDEAKLAPLARSVQRPKFFFRDDPEDQPMLIGIAPGSARKLRAARQ